MVLEKGLHSCTSHMLECSKDCRNRPNQRKKEPNKLGKVMQKIQRKTQARACSLFEKTAAGGGGGWHRGRLKRSAARSARAVQLFGRLAVLETHTLRY